MHSPTCHPRPRSYQQSILPPRPQPKTQPYLQHVRYDGLDRLQSAQRGQLNDTHTAITTLDAAQCWTLDPTGNWKEFRQDKNGDGTWDFNQTRTANQVNEITDISNAPSDIWATPVYDKNGNTTTNPRPDLGTNATMTATFDAWNRMTKLVDGSSSNVLLENLYDGRNFRIVAKEYTSGTLARTREYYFTDAWQCVEEHVDTSNTPHRQYVWGMRYIDDLVLRDRDISPSGGLLTERLYYLADANWNTTAVVSDSGSVQERYEYDPYGNLSVFEANFTPRAVSSYAVHYTYTSREWTPDAGLYYFRNRWYDAQLGRFSSRDPIGYEGSPWNLFEYVGSQPLKWTDPSGLIGPGDGGGQWPGTPGGHGPGAPPKPEPNDDSACAGYDSTSGSNCTECPSGKSVPDPYPGRAKAICKRFLDRYDRSNAVICVASCLGRSEGSLVGVTSCADRNKKRLDNHVFCYAKCAFVPVLGLPEDGPEVGWEMLWPDYYLW